MITIEQATQPPENNYEAFRLALFLVQLVEKGYVSPGYDKVKKTMKTYHRLKDTLSVDEVQRAEGEADELLEQIYEECRRQIKI